MKQIVGQEISAKEQQVIAFNKKLQAVIPKLTTQLQNLTATLTFLSQDSQYGEKNFPIVNDYLKKMKALLVELKTSFKTSQLLTPPPEPSSKEEGASDIYKKYEQQIAQIEALLMPLLTEMKNAKNIIAQSSGEKWIQNWSEQFDKWGEILKLSQRLQLVPFSDPSKNIQLPEAVAASSLIFNNIKKAYPSMVVYRSRNHIPDLKRWKETAQKMNAFRRAYQESYTFPQVLYHFTKDWDMFDRFEFKKWYKWTQMNKTSSLNEKIQKFAQKSSDDFVASDRLQQFQGRKKKFMQRVNLVRKSLQEMIHSQLIQQQDADKIYRILSMLELEAMRIQAPKLASARIRRASKQLEKLGFTEGASILSLAASEVLETKLVKVAAGADPQKAVEILRSIKQEMDVLSYGRHLDVLYKILKDLEAMGRQNDVEAVEKIIRDELGSLEKLNKKLIEVYTSLSKVPLELSTMEDFKSEEGKEVEEVPLTTKEEEALSPKSSLEVSEEEVESRERATSLADRIKKRREELQREREQSKAQPLPQLEQNIPNI